MPVKFYQTSTYIDVDECIMFSWCKYIIRRVQGEAECRLKVTTDVWAGKFNSKQLREENICDFITWNGLQ